MTTGGLFRLATSLGENRYNRLSNVENKLNRMLREIKRQNRNKIPPPLPAPPNAFYERKSTQPLQVKNKNKPSQVHLYRPIRLGVDAPSITTLRQINQNQNQSKPMG